MTRAVRISPVPIPPPAAVPRERPRTHGLLGAVLIVAGLLCYGGHILVAGDGAHSWDRHATPPAHVLLTEGETYLVSTAAGPGAPGDGTALACTYQLTDTSSPIRIAVTPITVESRATHAIGSFVATVSGEVTVGCSGGVAGSRPVFVDDADDAGSDLAGALLLVAVVMLVAGAGAATGAMYRRYSAGAVSGVTRSA